LALNLTLIKRPDADKALRHAAVALRGVSHKNLFIAVYNGYSSKGDMKKAIPWLEKALDAGIGWGAKEAKQELKTYHNNKDLLALFIKYGILPAKT